MQDIVTKYGMLAILLLLLLLLARALIRRDRSGTSKIDLDDLLIGEDGRLSKAAAVLLGSFGMTSWVIVSLTLKDKLTEGYFSAYLLAWVAPVVARIIKGNGAPAPVPNTVIDARTTTTVNAPAP